MKRVSFHTLGCRLNQSESAMMAETFRERGYQIVEHGSPTEVAVINTCSVTERADASCRNEIRKIRRKAPRALVCAVGCYVQSEPKSVAKISGIDIMVGTDKKMNLVKLLEEKSLPGQIREFISRKPDAADIEYPLAGYYPNTTRANLKIQDGCNFECAFCLLPRVRGAARSRPFKEIIAEGKELVRRGHKEVVITGINLGLYKNEGKTVGAAARTLSGIEGLERIRISSIEPTTVGNDLLDWMEEDPKSCRHLHLPLQSGNDETLRGMKRLYTTDEYAQFVEAVKKRMPDLGLGTDVIVGFPGETDQQFQETLAFIDALPFSYLHIFSYSHRPQTAASKRPDGVAREVTIERSQQARALAAKKKNAFFESHLGKTAEVLTESVDEDGWRKGFTRNYLRVGISPETSGENDLREVTLTSVEKDFCGAEITHAIA